MPVRIKTEKGSSVGPVLAGLAALITAVGGFIAVVHQFKKEDSKSPIVNPDPRPPAPTPNPAPSVHVGQAGQPLEKDHQQAPKLRAFEIDGYWSGVSDQYSIKFELFLHTDNDGKIVGTLSYGGCGGDGQHVENIPITSLSWDGVHLEVSLRYNEWPANSIPAAEHASRDASISLKVKNDSLTGTFHQRVYEGLTLNKSRMDWCSK
jgi:hypothetical protein